MVIGSDFSSFIVAFTAAILGADLLLAFVVFFQNRKELVNKIFFLLALSLAVWMLGVGSIFYFKDFARILLGFRVAFVGASLIGGFLFVLGVIFPYKLPRFAIKASIFALFVSWFYAAESILTGNIVASVNLTEAAPIAIYGSFYKYFSIFFLTIILATSLLLIKKYRETKEIVQKQQAKYFLIGIGFAIVIGVSTNLLIPLLTGVNYYSQFGPFATLMFLSFSAYAIVKHNLFNIKVIATEIFGATLVLIILIQFLTAKSLSQLLSTGFILVGSIVFSILLIRSVLNEVRAREEIEKLAKELEFTNKELKRLDQAKSDFISIASHQLRTPLSIVKGYISMIREGSYGDISENIRKTLNKIYLSNERLIKLVADLLDLSRMESGKLQYEFAEFNMVDLLDSTIDEFRIPAGDKRIELVWQKPHESFVVWGDSWKLRQVVFNLIDNGLKYTEKGSLAIALTKANHTVTLSVKDTGVGMTPETAHGLFQKFTRGKDSFKTNAQGLGLGLFIAKKIVDDHQGRLWAESDGEGKGSTFIIELPTASEVKQKKDFTSFVESM